MIDRANLRLLTEEDRITSQSSPLSQALECYRRRAARTEHPSGRFDADGRFWPDSSERCLCCDAIRMPSRRWPYTLMLHVRSIVHIARLFGVNVSDLRSAVAIANRAERAQLAEPGALRQDEPGWFVLVGPRNHRLPVWYVNHYYTGEDVAA